MDFPYLITLSERFHAQIRSETSGLPGLSILRRDAPSRLEGSVYEPVMCLILQGSKVTSIGDQTVTLTPGDVLLVSHDLPVVSQILQASRTEPYLAVILSLNLGVMRGLYDQVADVPLADADTRSLSVGRIDEAWMAPLVRYLELQDNPLDAKVLGPSILREIHYRLLLSPMGRMLRNLLVADSHASRIAKAIQQMRAEFRSTLSVADLARTAGMSASSFHEHFKSVTGTTPLTYQKDLRLIEARNILSQGSAVSEAAFAVGYESPTHFSRDYSRKFGLPPSRDAKDLMLTA